MPAGTPSIWNPVTQRHLRKTHCKHGHPLSGGNLRIGPNGTPCRVCGGAASVPSALECSSELSGLLGTHFCDPLLRSPIVFIMLTASLHRSVRWLATCPGSPKLPLLSEDANRSATAQRSCHLVGVRWAAEAAGCCRRPRILAPRRDSHVMPILDHGQTSAG
jgi:hypothetical protein